MPRQFAEAELNRTCEIPMAGLSCLEGETSWRRDAGVRSQSTSGRRAHDDRMVSTPVENFTRRQRPAGRGRAKMTSHVAIDRCIFRREVESPIALARLRSSSLLTGRDPHLAAVQRNAEQPEPSGARRCRITCRYGSVLRRFGYPAMSVTIKIDRSAAERTSSTAGGARGRDRP